MPNKTDRVTLRVDAATKDRLTAIMARLEADPRSAGFAVSYSAAARMAMLRGLEVLEGELAKPKARRK
jgi:hypothetical protein